MASSSQGAQETMLEPNRDDLSSGMVVVPPRPIHDNEETSGPLVCFPFYLKEQSSLPTEFLKIVWILHSAQCNVQNGKVRAFMDLKNMPFTCQFRGKNEKPIIVDNGGAIQAEMQVKKGLKPALSLSLSFVLFWL